MPIDLQTHTLASDGKLTPTELVKKAAQLGLLYIAKTDHDNLNLTAEFLAAGKKYNIHTIPGIELSSQFKGKSIHILGLGVDYKDKKIQAYSKKVAKLRKTRALKMVKKLNQAGWHIKRDEIKKKIIARPHVALSVINHPANKKRLIAEFKTLPTFSTFIRKYLVLGKPCYVDKPYRIPARQAIKLIKHAKGLAIISHPLSKSIQFNYTQKQFNDILKLNFDGLEVYSSEHTAQDIQRLKKIVKKYNLLASAGSDYHGHDEKVRPLGICHNGKYVDQKLCQPLLDKLSK